MNKIIKDKLLYLSEEIYIKTEMNEDCSKLISEYSEIFLSKFSNIEYPSDKFIIGSSEVFTVTDIIPGTIRHRIYPYSVYNLVWIDPDTLEIIDNFSINNSILNISSPFIDVILSDIRNGFIFEDLDRYNVNNIPDNIKGMDTLTHYIPRVSCNDYLVYSKKLGNGQELRYKVLKPVKINNKWICKIEFY